MSEILPMTNTALLLLVLVGGGGFVTWFFLHVREWTGPRQASALAQLRRDVDSALRLGTENKREIDAAHDKADAVARENNHFRQELRDANEHQLREIRSLARHFEAILSMREDLRAVQEQAMRTEQDLAALSSVLPKE